MGFTDSVLQLLLCASHRLYTSFISIRMATLYFDYRSADLLLSETLGKSFLALCTTTPDGTCS